MAMETSAFGVQPLLVGRSSEIQILLDMFKSEKNSVVTIIGTTGIGKSLLTTKFGHKIMAEEKRNFLRLNGHSHQSLRHSLSVFLDSTQLPQKTKPRETVDMFHDVVSNFNIFSKKFVLMIDNVNDLSVLKVVRSLLNETVQENCFVIVITNAKNVHGFEPIGDVLNVSILQSPDAERVISSGLPSPISESDVQNLAKLLHNFPLAVGLAIAYIHVQIKDDMNYKVGDYIDQFQNYRVEILDEASITTIEHEYITPTLTAWNISIGKINQSGEIAIIATTLLNAMAYCDPEVIPINFLWRLNGHIQRQQIEDASTLAFSYRLVDGDGVAFRINRLLQKIIRSKISSSETEIEFLKKIVQTIHDDVYSVLSAVDMPHVQSIWNHAANYPEIIKEYPKITDMIADKLFELAMYMDFLEFSIKYEAKLAEIFGPHHLETLVMGSQVAYALWTNGRFEESLDKHNEVYDIQKEILGEYNELTMITLNNKALVLGSIGIFDDELKIFKTLWDNKKAHLGEDHPKTLESMENYINSLWNHGAYEIPKNIDDFVVAFKLLDELIEMQSRVLGEDHPSVWQTKLRWAGKYCGLDRPDKTVRLMKEVFASKTKILGPQHSETIFIKKHANQFLRNFSDHRLLAGETQLE